MSNIAIRLTGVSKMYRMFRTRRLQVMDLLGLPIPKKAYEEFWALRDIDLVVPRGGKIGIIGHNGAGKSTLLKIIAGQVQPSGGEVEIRGRIQALMELGTGFHPEFTGRENILSALSYQGVFGEKARHKFDEIVDFSELEQFIDNPVKTYSAGMYARLAFSVATAIEPEILIIDEVLGAGDAYFSGKCIGRMKQLTELGATVLFVSHDMGSVQRLCEKAVWINKGRIAASGDTLEVSKHYLKQVRDREERRMRAISMRLQQGSTEVDNPGPEMLSMIMHFIVDEWSAPKQSHPISRMAIVKGDAVLAEIMIGDAADNDASSVNHAIIQQGFIQWGPTIKLAGRYCREFKAVGGRYNHAACKLAVERGIFLEPGDVHVIVEYFDLGEENFHLEIFDGEQYQRVGTIIPAGTDCWKTAAWPMVDFWSSRNSLKPEHNELPSRIDQEPAGNPTDIPAVAVAQPITLSQLGEHERYGIGGIRIVFFGFFDSEGQQRHLLVSGHQAQAKIGFETSQIASNPVAVVAIYRPDGTCALQAISSRDGLSLGQVQGRGSITLNFAPLFLGPGEYVVSVALFKEFDLSEAAEPPAYDLHDRCYPLKILPPEGIGVEIGVVNQPVRWTVVNGIP